MPPPNSKVQTDYALYADQLSPGLREDRYLFIEPHLAPLVSGYGTVAAPVAIPTAYAAAATGLTVFAFDGGKQIENYQGTVQTLPPAIHATKGWNITGDAVDNESNEFVPGGNHIFNPYASLLGTDPGVFIRLTLEITAPNGLDQLVVGFRKQEPYLLPTSFLAGGAAGYTDFFGIGFNKVVTTPNEVGVVSSVGGAVNIRSGSAFTWAAGGIHRLEVQVKGRSCKAFVNNNPLGGGIRISKDALGAAITAQAVTGHQVYNFTNALRIIPFWFVRQDAATSAVYVRRIECGRLVDINGDLANRI